MAEEGTTYTIDLPVKGQDKIDAASKSLDTLAAKLAEQKDAYGVAERSANSAALAVEKLGVAAEEQRATLASLQDVGDWTNAEKAAKKLSALNDRQHEAAGKAAALKAELDKQAQALDALAQSYHTAKAAADVHAGQKPKEESKALKKPEEEKKPEDRLEAMKRGLHDLGGPLADVSSRFDDVLIGYDKLKKSLGDAGPYLAAAAGVTALGAAIVGVGVSAIESTKHILEWSAGLSDANRSFELLTQGIARSVAGGTQLDNQISNLAKTLPFTQQELESMAAKLANAGLRGDALSSALDRSALAAAKLKFGPNFSAEMLSLDQQTKIFHDNISDLFGGLKIDGLLAGLQKLIALFDSSTASGKAIKVVFESIFQPIVNGVADSSTKIEAFFLRLEILALKALIWLKPHGSVILKIGEAFLVVAGIIVGALLTALAAILVPLAAGIAILTAIVAAVIIFKDRFIGAFQAVKNWLANFSLADVGKAMIDGLVAGITNGGAAILSAMKGAVMGAVNGVKSLLGIHSPSTLFEKEIGAQIGAGTAAGVDKSAGGVQDSLESMVQPPAGKSAAAPPTAAAKGSGANVSGNTFVFQGVKDADDAEQRFGELLTRILEGDGTQIGAVTSA